MRIAALTLALLAIVTLSACTTYYKIHDPTTGNDYYTTEYEREDSGGVSFQNDKTGEKVTVQNSEISEVNEGTYLKNTANE